MRITFLCSLLVVIPVLCAAKNAEIQAISNPHATAGQSSSGTCKINEDCPLIGALDLSSVVSDPITTQSGTFMGIIRKVVHGTEVDFPYFVS
jgi:hypothetical protein